MNVTVIGTGYVGLVSGACLSEMGSQVTCVDINEKKINNLKKGILPIYEPGLEELIKRNTNENRLTFTTSLKKALAETDVIFIAVGTPTGEDGSADLQYVLAVAKEIGTFINNYVVVVTKSTVPVGTSKLVEKAIKDELASRNEKVDLDIASNPEFLKEGVAVQDFMRPDRIVVGVNSKKARTTLERLYQPFVLNGHPLMFMDIPSAELTKYTANAMLATRISFMNDIANLAEIVGANINDVRKGIAADARIGNKFLYSGIGYGGSCFPKDVKALVKTGAEKQHDLRILEAVEMVNEEQKKVLFQKINNYFKGTLKGKTIALWGLAFKPNTDDMREAPSLIIIQNLLASGATVRVFDPVATETAKRHLDNTVIWTEDMYEAAEGADALALVTEWNEFKLPNWERLANLVNRKAVFDGRNIYNREEVEREGFDYFGIGQ